MYISVIGPTASRRRLLAVIRAEFEQIHRDIKDLNPVEMVPLPGQPGAALAYSDLLVREANDRFRFNSVINGEVIDLDAHELLEGVDLEDSRREERLTIERDRPVRVFYSYSHKDELLRNELAAHLTLLRRQNVIDSWHDRLISAGDDWKGKIDENLERAEIVLLLISADFISSEYCYDVEMNRALQRHEEGQAHVVAIILRDANLKGAPFDKFEWLPTDGKAVTLWEHRDSAWRNVSEGIQKLAETMRKERLS